MSKQGKYAFLFLLVLVVIQFCLLYQQQQMINRLTLKTDKVIERVYPAIQIADKYWWSTDKVEREKTNRILLEAAQKERDELNEYLQNMLECEKPKCN